MTKQDAMHGQATTGQRSHRAAGQRVARNLIGLQKLILWNLSHRGHKLSRKMLFKEFSPFLRHKIGSMDV